MLNTIQSGVADMSSKNITQSNVEIYHIGYNDQTVRSKPDDFLLLDNRDNLRPDWYEYWPIRKFLLENELQDGKYYGFFSPKFQEKTGIFPNDILNFIGGSSRDFDVFFACPQPEAGHFFKNIYYGSEFFDAGALHTCQKIFDYIELPVNVVSLVTDSRNTVFSNYVVARKEYWILWLSICEKIFNLAENEFLSPEIWHELNKKTTYGNSVQRKVFVIEGIASLILSKFGFKSISLELNRKNAFKGLFYSEDGESYLCDALKIAFVQTNNDVFIKKFHSKSNEMLNKFFKNKPDDQGFTMKQTPAHDKYNDTIFSLLLKYRPANVIEVGCMRGTLAREYIKSQGDCRWTGVDIDCDNILEASKICHYSLCADVESLPISSIPNFENADVWVFGDVLEHLRDPWHLLKRLREAVRPGTKIIACIPNSQHWSFQVRVNIGLMQYQDDGLFDRTHLRFFSRLTMTELFVNAGYSISNIYPRVFNFPGYEKYIKLIRDMAELSGADPDQVEADSMAYQYVIEVVA